MKPELSVQLARQHKARRQAPSTAEFQAIFPDRALASADLYPRVHVESRTHGRHIRLLCDLIRSKPSHTLGQIVAEAPMDEIRRVAVECIGRAVMFGSLAIGCVMIGFSFNPVSTFRSGAFLTLAMALVLMWKANTSGTRNPKHTEVWLYLDAKSRPVDGPALRVFGTIMREVYQLYARIALGVAVGFFVLSLVLMLFGLEGYTPPAN
jgi:hypothetical protein